MVAAAAQMSCGRDLTRGTARSLHSPLRPGAPASHASLASPSRRAASAAAVPALLLRFRAQQRERTLSALRCRAAEVPATGGGSGGGGMGGGSGGGGGGGGGGDGASDESKGASSAFGLAALWGEYLRMLDTHPLRTKAFTSLLLNALGDIICQLLIEKKTSVDPKRLAVTSALGFLLVGPTLHFWYGTLSKIVTVGGTTGAIMRLVLDQFCFSPPFIAVFFAALLTLEGRPQEITAKLKQDLKPAVLTNWKLWIPFQFLNFRFVPLRLQVAASNIVAVAWNAYLSLASHRELED